MYIYIKLQIMKTILTCFLLVLFVFQLNAQVSRTVDHTCTDIHSIPDNWIDSAKAKLNIVYWRASHGTHLTNGGMRALVNYNSEFATKFAYDENDGEGVLKLVEFLQDLQHESATWVATTEAYLQSHPDVNIVMWAWCSIIDQDIDQYLADMELLISKYGEGGSQGRENPVRFIFMNGHTYPYNGNGEGEYVYNANWQIKRYCEENSHWFYDFYDLECFDPDGDYFGDGTPDGGPYNGDMRLRADMSYDHPEGGRANWGVEWLAANPGSELALLSADNVCVNCEHSEGDHDDDNSRLQCVLKGQAAWWLWARLAGWNEEVSPPVLHDSVRVYNLEGLTSLDKGSELQFLVHHYPGDVSNRNVVWSVTSMGGQASVSSSGLVEALQPGIIYVKARAADNEEVTDSIEIEILDTQVLVEEIQVSGYGGVQVIEDQNLQMLATVLPGSADNKEIVWSIVQVTGEAQISTDGVLTPVSPGTITVIASATDGSGVTGSCQVTITESIVMVEEITVSGAEGVLSIDETGGTLQMEAEILPSNASHKEVQWSVENLSGTAIISPSGMLTAKGDGDVKVIATSTDGSGIAGDCMVTVSNQVIDVTDIIVSGEEGIDYIDVLGGTLQMHAEVLPENATDKTISWYCAPVSDGAGAKIDSSGMLIADMDGIVEVIATSACGCIVRTKRINISNQSISIDPLEEIKPVIFVRENQLFIDIREGSTQQSDLNLVVYSIRGQAISSSQLNQGINQIEINNGPGMYILMLKSHGKVKTFKTFITR